MELMACAKALDWALQNEPWRDVNRLYVVTDSTYLARHHGNAQYWKKDGWRNLAGEIPTTIAAGEVRPRSSRPS